MEKEAAMIDIFVVPDSNRKLDMIIDLLRSDKTSDDAIKYTIEHILVHDHYLNKIPDDVLIKCIHYAPNIFKYVTSPSYSVCYEAVNERHYNINYIKNRSIIRRLVIEIPVCIKYMSALDDDLLSIYACLDDGYNLYCMRHTEPEVILAAMNCNGMWSTYGKIGGHVLVSSVLNLVSDKDKTYIVCKTAVINDYNAILYVPKGEFFDKLMGIFRRLYVSERSVIDDVSLESIKTTIFEDGYGRLRAVRDVIMSNIKSDRYHLILRQLINGKLTYLIAYTVLMSPVHHVSPVHYKTNADYLDSFSDMYNRQTSIHKFFGIGFNTYAMYQKLVSIYPKGTVDKFDMQNIFNGTNDLMYFETNIKKMTGHFDIHITFNQV
jgi:hypothetical protein